MRNAFGSMKIAQNGDGNINGDVLLRLSGGFMWISRCYGVASG